MMFDAPKKKLEPNLHRTKYLHDRGNRTTPVWWSWKFKSYNLLQHLRTWIDIHRYPITYSCPISTGPSSVLLQGWGNYHLHVLHARRFRLWLKGWLDLVSIHILGDQITGSSANSFSKSWCFFFVLQSRETIFLLKTVDFKGILSIEMLSNNKKLSFDGHLSIDWCQGALSNDIEQLGKKKQIWKNLKIRILCTQKQIFQPHAVTKRKQIMLVLVTVILQWSQRSSLLTSLQCRHTSFCLLPSSGLQLLEMWWLPTCCRLHL